MDDLRLYCPVLTIMALLSLMIYHGILSGRPMRSCTQKYILIFKRPGKDYAVIWNNSSLLKNIILKFILVLLEEARSLFIKVMITHLINKHDFN